MNTAQTRLTPEQSRLALKQLQRIFLREYGEHQDVLRELDESNGYALIAVQAGHDALKRSNARTIVRALRDHFAPHFPHRPGDAPIPFSDASDPKHDRDAFRDLLWRSLEACVRAWWRPQACAHGKGIGMDGTSGRLAREWAEGGRVL